MYFCDSVLLMNVILCSENAHLSYSVLARIIFIIMAHMVNLLRSAAQSWSLLGGRAVATRLYSPGRTTKESFMCE